VTPDVIIRDALIEAARSLGAPDPIEPVVERPRDPTFGDWTTNLAMTLARTLRRKPQEIARDLIAGMDVQRAGVREATVAGAGFINFRLDTGAATGGLASVIAAGESFGRHNEGQGAAFNVEFVSANPTGPLHVGHGRQAALGDAIASLLEWNGWAVTREFYYNDGGGQIQNLALSVRARLIERLSGTLEIPEGGYHGEYIREIAAAYADAHPDDARGDDLEGVRTFAIKALREEQDRDLKALGVHFDVYFLESSLYTEGNVDETVRMLASAGHTFEEGGATWLRTTDYGDDKDRVMRKSDGSYTYFVPDVAACDQRAGSRPSQHGRAGPRRPASARPGDSAGLSGVPAAPDGHRDAWWRRGEDFEARRQLRHGARPGRRSRSRCGALLPADA
jgi:arginyl-tRNA synthetase